MNPQNGTLQAPPLSQGQSAPALQGSIQNGMLQSNNQPPQLDSDAVNLAKAIRQHESGGDFQAKGKSGEYGAYQFMPDTWSQWSKQYLGQDIPLGNATPEQQNEVAYKRIKELKDKGYNIGQVASAWNSGNPDAYKDPNFKGVNSHGAQFNVSEYAQKIAETYQAIKNGAPSPTPSGPSTVSPDQQTQQPGFIQRAAQTIASPFLKVIASGGALLEAGNKDNYNKIQNEGMDFGYLGKAKPVGAGFDVTKGVSENKKPLLDAAGTGAEIASYIAPAGALGKTVEAARGGRVLPVLAKGAFTGAEAGALQGAGSALQSDDPNLKNVVGATALGALGGAATGGALGAIGGKLGKLTGKGSQNAAIDSNLANLNEIEKSNAPLRKFTEKSRTDGFDPIKDIAKTDLLMNAVDKDGVVRTIGEGRAVDQYKGAMQEMEGVVRNVLQKEGATVKADSLQKQAFKAIEDAGLQGAVKKRAQQEALADIEQFTTDVGSQDIPLTLVHDAKISRYMTNNYLNPEANITGKAIARGYKRAVDSGTKSVEVDAINKELQRHMANLDFLERLDGKRVTGGRLGKYFASTVGAIAGSHAGPLGTIVGADIGSRIMGRQLSSKFGKSTGGLIPEASAAMKRAVRVGQGAERKLPIKSLESDFTNETKTIEAGKTPVSKKKRSLPGLPTIRY